MCPSKSPNNTEYHITYMSCKSSYHILFCRIDRYSPNMLNQHWDERKIARGQLDLAQMPNPEARLIQLLPRPPIFGHFYCQVSFYIMQYLVISKILDKNYNFFECIASVRGETRSWFFFAAFCISLPPSPRLSNYLMDTKICTARFLWIIPTCNTTLVTACICTTTTKARTTLRAQNYSELIWLWDQHLA